MYHTYRDSVVAIGDETLSVLVPEIDEEATIGVAGKFRALLCVFGAFNGTDHDFMLAATKKHGVRFGHGWDKVWSKCGGFPSRVTK
jgi:hypothetical protein